MACMIIGVQVDKVLDSPKEALKEVYLTTSQALKFIKAVVINPDMKILRELPSDEITRIGTQVCADFFLCAWMQHLEGQQNGFLSLAQTHGLLQEKESPLPLKPSWQVDPSRSTEECLMLRLKT